ncbi:GntR family transcriptional regulator [Antribacter gilvus]|uniref:GntR family transcriptional regulator n=1 Tax=Antribacter gilvus TaxID=2304675 RepID=UPI0013DF73C3|nr:GntR family transcriptional regulator [Antribacter gilvus]
MTIERSEHPYLQIAQQIRADIESGALPVGSKIPSAREIRDRWGVAIATGTKVHAHLRSLGLVEPVPGVGTVVRARSVESSGRAYLKRSASAEGQIYGGKKRARVMSSEMVDAPGYVAEALGVPDGSPVVRRERVSFAGEVPVSASVSWIPGAYAEGAPQLLSTERIPKGTFGYLAQTLGLRLASGREMLSASAATAAHADALGVPEGSPVLLTRSWFLAESGQILEYGEGVNPADYWLTHEFTA